MPRANRYFLPDHVWHTPVKWEDPDEIQQSWTAGAVFHPSVLEESTPSETEEGFTRQAGQVGQVFHWVNNP